MALRHRYQTVEFGDLDIHVRTLRNTNEFDDEDGAHEALGVPTAMWPIFGVLWDCGTTLARLMVDHEVEGLRILEVGCGIGLASLVLNHRNADITATDRHPHAEKFLDYNAKLNQGANIPFMRTNWNAEHSDLGQFDLIIGSDLLYDREQTSPLSKFIDEHANPSCEVILIDPGRGQAGRMARQMTQLGYTHSSHKDAESIAAGDRTQIHSYQRSA